MRAQLGGEHDAGGARRVERHQMVLRPQGAEAAHRRQAGEAVGAGSAAPAAFVVDRDDQRRVAQPADLGGERAQLLRSRCSCARTGSPADQRSSRRSALLVGERGAGDIDHDGGRVGGGPGGFMFWEAGAHIAFDQGERDDVLVPRR